MFLVVRRRTEEKIVKTTSFSCGTGQFLANGLMVRNVNCLNTLEPMGGTELDGALVIRLREGYCNVFSMLTFHFT